MHQIRGGQTTALEPHAASEGILAQISSLR